MNIHTPDRDTTGQKGRATFVRFVRERLTILISTEERRQAHLIPTSAADPPI
jgi:hypothetical protein